MKKKSRPAPIQDDPSRMEPKLNSPEPRRIEIRHKHEEMGGSRWKEFNHVLLKQVIGSLWMAHAGSKDGELELYDAAAAALAGIKPKGVVEGMLAAQMVAAHSASMECYRRAMLKDQTFEGRKESLSQANKLSRTYTMQIEALSRYRGNGQQKVTVEHVHVHAGGQAVVGAVDAGGGVATGNQRQPHAKAISYAPVAPLWSENPERDPCRSPAMSNGRCRMHGGKSPGAPKGEANGNYRHGRFTREAIERRRDLNALIRMLSHAAEEVA